MYIYITIESLLLMPRKSSKTKTSKKIATNELEIADGKFESVDEKHQKNKSIEELLVVNKNPFGTNSKAELEEKLEGMNLRQMQEMAVKASVFPSGNKTSLKKKITREFVTKFGTNDGSKKYSAQSEGPIMDPESKLAKEVMQILNGK